jgi:hypothetical protein
VSLSPWIADSLLLGEAEIPCGDLHSKKQTLRRHDAIENGIAGVDDLDLKDRIETLEATSDQAETAAAWATASLSAECPKAVAQQVKVPADEVRILGSKRNLLQALVAEVAKKIVRGARLCSEMVPLAGL